MDESTLEIHYNEVIIVIWIILWQYIRGRLYLLLHNGFSVKAVIRAHIPLFLFQN